MITSGQTISDHINQMISECDRYTLTQKTPVNVITLCPNITDHINRMITISKCDRYAVTDLVLLLHTQNDEYIYLNYNYSQ